MPDVIIVGGSVAGCASALAMSRLGLKVLLLERAGVGRDKACGEGLLPAGVAALTRLGAYEAAARAQAHPFYGVGFELEGQVARADFAAGHALGVRRRLFDEALFSLAAAQPNVEARDHCAVRGLLLSSSEAICGVTLASGEELRAPLVVAADGLASALRTAAGLDGGMPRRRRYGVRVHFSLSGPLPFGQYVHVLLDPPGEFYLTPVGPAQVQVAFLGDDLAARGLSRKTYAEEVLSHPLLRERLSGATVSSEVMGAGPFGRRARGVVRDGLALVGDAAGYVDAVTGEGMELALRSAEVLGEVAAQAFTQGGPSAQRLQAYAEARAKIVQDPDRLTKLVLLLERFPGLARRAIKSLNRNPGLFQRLLAVQGGEAPLSSLSIRDWLGLAGL